MVFLFLKKVNSSENSVVNKAVLIVKNKIINFIIKNQIKKYILEL